MDNEAPPAVAVTSARNRAARSRDWLKITTLQGLGALQEIFSDMADGRVAADEGVIIEL